MQSESKTMMDEEKNYATINENQNTLTKYPMLSEGLRDHVLTYLYSKTLLNYSQCSRSCNSEIQKYNTKPPSILSIIEYEDGIQVNLSYATIDDNLHIPESSIEKLFTFSKFWSYDVTLERVMKYLLKVYQYVKNGKTQRLAINLKKWPAEIMRIESLAELENWDVYMHNSMLEDFVDLVEKGTIQVKKLHLSDNDEKNKIKIGKDHAKRIFNSQLFQQLEEVHISLDCEIDDDDFMNFNQPTIFLELNNLRISDDAIRRKVTEINVSSEKFDIKIEIPEECPVKFELRRIFPCEFPHLRIIDIWHSKIGDVSVSQDDRFEIQIFKAARPVEENVVPVDELYLLELLRF